MSVLFQGSLFITALSRGKKCDVVAFDLIF